MTAASAAPTAQAPASTDGSAAGTRPDNAGLVLGFAHPGGGRRQPEPVGGERRPAVDRQVVRLVPDDAGPHRRRLLAGPGRVGAVVRRPRRPLRPQADDRAGHGAGDPGVARGRLRPVDTVLLGARIVGGLSAGMAYPTTLALITALWTRRRPNALDRAVVGTRRRHCRPGPAPLRFPAGAIRVGIGLPGHDAAGAGRAVHGLATRASPCQRVDRARRQPGRRPVGANDRRAGHRVELHHRRRACGRSRSACSLSPP